MLHPTLNSHLKGSVYQPFPSTPQSFKKYVHIALLRCWLGSAQTYLILTKALGGRKPTPHNTDKKQGLKRVWVYFMLFGDGILLYSLGKPQTHDTDTLPLLLRYVLACQWD